MAALLSKLDIVIETALSTKKLSFYACQRAEANNVQGKKGPSPDQAGLTQHSLCLLPFFLRVTTTMGVGLFCC